jgi:glycosyltransferase involved in cell wall biosynthesis
MNILLVHNFYQQAGGEDGVFAEEFNLLKNRGHNVAKFTMDNDSIEGMGKLTVAKKTIWNKQSQAPLRDAIHAIGAEVVHFHNTFPLVSPAAYYTAHDAGAATVQTLHNYRLLCPAATFYRDGGVCEDCLHKSIPWPGVLHKCYRDNRSASAVVAAMLTYHRAKGTWRDEVDLYIALTEFARSRFVAAGFPEAKIAVKPNFVDPDPGVGRGDGGFVLFVGRLTEEKGIPVLLEAWKRFSAAAPQLKIVGDGPLRELVEQAAAGNSSIQYAGRRAPDEVYALMGSARALVFPSVWYEGLPRTIVECYAKGTPVVASRLGSMTELIDPCNSGALFEPGNPADLAAAISALPVGDAMAAMRAGARRQFETRFTAEINHPLLISLYRRAISARPAAVERRPA